MNSARLPTSIPMSVRLWLATEHYDHNDDPNTISVTSIIKPTKQLLLGLRVQPAQQGPVNVNTLASSKIGNAIHEDIERAWKGDREAALEALGIPKAIQSRIQVNPSEEALKADPDIIPVYIEQRADKIVDGITISGKFDFLIEGGLEDFKTTSTFSYVHGAHDDKWGLQGSIYRWLNQEKVTKDYLAIQYIFINWQQSLVAQDPRYPKTRILEHKIPLMPINEVQTWLENKVAEVKRLVHSPEEDMPPCSDEDLWRKDPVFKYYKNPQKLARSTKNFDNMADAQTRLAKDGFVGVVIEKKGTVGFCQYCAAAPICKQKDEYILDGSLVL